MENNDFTHLAPLPAHYLRLQEHMSGSQWVPGAGGSSLEQIVAANMTKPRDAYMQDMKGQFNPVWEQMIDKTPTQYKKELKKIMKTGMGSEASQKFLTNPAIQQAMGTSGIADMIATDRMYSHAGSLGANLKMPGGGSAPTPTNPGDLVAQNQARVAGTAQYQSTLYNKLYRNEVTGKIEPQGNMRFTGGMKTSDFINLGSYASKFGGPMSEMAVARARGRGESEAAYNNDEGVQAAKAQTNNKAEYHGKMARTLSEFAKTMGSKDMDEALQQFKELEGKEFGTINPETFAKKLHAASSVAAAANMSAKEVLKMQTYGEGMMSAVTRMGTGSEYDVAGGPEMDKGYSEHATTRGLAVAKSMNITDPQEAAKVVARQQKRQAVMMDTTGGRTIDMAQKLKDAGRMSQGLYDEVMLTAGQGGNVAKHFAAIESETGMNMKQTIMNDVDYRENRYQLSSDIKENAKKTALQAGYSPDRAEAFANDKLKAGETEASKVMSEKLEKDQVRIGSVAKLKSNKRQVANMGRELGVSFNKEQLKAHEGGAITDLEAQIKADKTISEDKRSEFLDKIALAKDNGDSLMTIQKSLGKMGPEGVSFAATAGSNLERRKLVAMTAGKDANGKPIESAFTKGYSKTMLKEGNEVLKSLKLDPVNSELNAEGQQDDQRRKLEALIKDPELIAAAKADPKSLAASKLNTANRHLGKMNKAKADSESRANLAQKGFDEQTNLGDVARNTGENLAQRKAANGNLGSETAVAAETERLKLMQGKPADLEPEAQQKAPETKEAKDKRMLELEGNVVRKSGDPELRKNYMDKLRKGAEGELKKAEDFRATRDTDKAGEARKTADAKPAITEIKGEITIRQDGKASISLKPVAKEKN